MRGGVMARLKNGARVERVGGEWIERAGVGEPVYGVVLQVRDHDGSCLVKFDDDDHQERLRWTDLAEVYSEPG
jgi:hypothetical protein